ncbi:MAG: hypothetical protein JXM70_15855, partial [Pirellulales bacterium]|nr:hypothetical protein [Pirellulales bacterium]
SLLRPAAEKADVRINPAQRHQVMIGFGGITTPTAYTQLSSEGKKRWWQLLSQYNLLIQREYPIGTRLHKNMDNWDRLEDATPHYYGDNFPNGEISDFDYLKTFRRIGGQVWFEFWALPPWMCTESHEAGKQGIPKSRKVDIQAYVRGMVDYCRTSQKRSGAPPEVVGIQNEVTQPPEVWHAMTRALRRGLDEAGFRKVRIHMADSSNLRGGIKCAEAFRSDKRAWETIDYAAAHMYDYQGFFDKPDAYDPLLKKWKQVIGDKPFLSTEICVNSGRFQWPEYRLALSMGQLYHKNLTLADASAICYCWTLLNVVQPSYGWTRALFVPDCRNGFVPTASSHQLRVFGAYSRRIRHGMTRVEALSSEPDLLVSAFTGKDASKTIVLLNRSVRPLRVSLNCRDTRFNQQELVDSYCQNKILAAPAPDGNDTTQFTIEPGSIVTLTNVLLGKLPDGM